MRIKAVALYSAAVPIAIGLAFYLTYAAFDATEGLPWQRMPRWTILALNFLPPVVAGAATSGVLAWWARRRGWYVATVRDHFKRLALGYLLSASIVGLIVSNQRSSDYGLWSQLIEWPLAALIGLALVDFTITMLIREHRLAAI